MKVTESEVKITEEHHIA